jgi:hypothetical protein
MAARFWLKRKSACPPIIAAVSRRDVRRTTGTFGEQNVATQINRLPNQQGRESDAIRESPDCLRQLSELLAKRKMETEGILKDAATSKRGSGCRTARIQRHLPQAPQNLLRAVTS